MIKIEIGEPLVTVSIRISDSDGKTTEADWKNLALALKKGLAKIDERFEDIHYIDFFVRSRGDFDLEGSKEEVEAGIQVIKEITQAQNIELEIGD